MDTPLTNNQVLALSHLADGAIGVLYNFDDGLIYSASLVYPDRNPPLYMGICHRTLVSLWTRGFLDPAPAGTVDDGQGQYVINEAGLAALRCITSARLKQQMDAFDRQRRIYTCDYLALKRARRLYGRRRRPRQKRGAAAGDPAAE